MCLVDDPKSAARPGPTIGFVRHVAAQLLEAAGPAAVAVAATRADLADPLQTEADVVIDLLQEAAFVEAAAEITGNIDFGFLACLSLSIGTSLPGYISEHSPTLRDALLDAARFLPQARPGMDFALEELGTGATLQLRLSDPRLQHYPRHREAVFAGVIGQIRSFTARPFHPKPLHFHHERAPLSSAARAGLGCPGAFGATTTDKLLGLPVLDRPIRGRDDALRALLVSHGELIVAQSQTCEASFAERVELRTNDPWLSKCQRWRALHANWGVAPKATLRQVEACYPTAQKHIFSSTATKRSSMGGQSRKCQNPAPTHGATAMFIAAILGFISPGRSLNPGLNRARYSRLSDVF